MVIKGILKLPQLEGKLKEAVALVKWFRNRHAAIVELRIKQVQLYKKDIPLALLVLIRWQSNSDCLKSLLQCREALEQVAVEGRIR